MKVEPVVLSIQILLRCLVTSSSVPAYNDVVSNVVDPDDFVACGPASMLISDTDLDPDLGSGMFSKGMIVARLHLSYCSSQRCLYSFQKINNIFILK